MLHAAPDAAQVDADDAIPFVTRALGGRGDLGHDARVIEQDVDVARVAVGLGPPQQPPLAPQQQSKSCLP